MDALRIATPLLVSCLVAGCVPKPVTNLRPDENKCAMPTENDQLPQTPVLVEQGNDYLDSALRGLSRPHLDPVGVETLLNHSSICFSRALRLTPDSYEAQLSMGVVFLARARLAEEGSLDQSHMLAGARHMLGRAYMLRHGAYEPLYYLAEVAMAEGNLLLAKAFLEPLQAAGVKDGPTNLLLGSLSERQHDTKAAVGFYHKALEAGWPVETFMFATGRLQHLGSGQLQNHHASSKGL